MKVRHKTPTLVSMWMLDVFCCALGCVTLLWLLNTRQAGDQATAARSVTDQLAQTVKALADTRTRLAGLNTEAGLIAERLRNALTDQADLTGRLVVAEREGLALQTRVEEANRSLAVSRAEADATKLALADAQKQAATNAEQLVAAREKAAARDKDLTVAQARAKAAEADLLQKKQEIDALTRRVADANAAVDDLARLVREKSNERVDLEARYQSLRRDLADAEAKLAAAEKSQANTSAAAGKTRTDLEAARTEAIKAGQELAAAKKRITELEGQVAAAGSEKATIIDLQGKNQKLADQIDKLQRDTENRFAGVAMTGKRVVLLIDVSGSMTKTDERTPNPAKWPLVCDTVAKVMRSIATLEKYQVVVFSGKARWLLPPLGDWRSFEGERSVVDVKTELLKVVPNEDTNLYAGFDLAFGLRAKGLDTIYLFSDGLPTSGPGLSPSQENANPPLAEEKRSEILGDHLLQQLRVRWNRPLVNNERVRINSIGFFYQSPTVGAFLWNLSRENDGSFVGMSKP